MTMTKVYLLVRVKNDKIVEISSKVYTSFNFAVKMVIELNSFEKGINNDDIWLIKDLELDTFVTSNDLRKQKVI